MTGNFWVSGTIMEREDYTSMGGDVEWSEYTFEESFETLEAAVARFAELHARGNVVGLTMSD